MLTFNINMPVPVKAVKDKTPLLSMRDIKMYSPGLKLYLLGPKSDNKQVAFQSNANHPLAESMGYIKFEGM